VHGEHGTGDRFIYEYNLDAQRRKQVRSFVQATAWNGDMLWEILGASNNARLIERRKAHRLSLVDLRVLERSETNQFVDQCGRQVLLGYEHLVCQYNLDRFWKVARNCYLRAALRWWQYPRLIVELVIQGNLAHSENVTLTLRFLNDTVRGLDINKLDACEIPDPILVGYKAVINEH